jgi:hypothetical protein
MPESHKPLGTPLSSLCTPLVPLVVEWNEPCQFQMTESFTEIDTAEGENVSVAPGPTRTLVVAPKDGCAIKKKNNTDGRMAKAVFKRVFTRTKSGVLAICSQKFQENPLGNYQDGFGYSKRKRTISELTDCRRSGFSSEVGKHPSMRRGTRFVVAPLNSSEPPLSLL